MIENGFHPLPIIAETESVIGVTTTTDLTTYLSSRVCPSRLANNTSLMDGTASHYYSYITSHVSLHGL